MSEATVEYLFTFFPARQFYTIENYKGSKSLFSVLNQNIFIFCFQNCKLNKTTAEQRQAKRENEFKTLGLTSETFSVLL